MNQPDWGNLNTKIGPLRLTEPGTHETIPEGTSRSIPEKCYPRQAEIKAVSYTHLDVYKRQHEAHEDMKSKEFNKLCLNSD